MLEWELAIERMPNLDGNWNKNKLVINKLKNYEEIKIISMRTCL